MTTPRSCPLPQPRASAGVPTGFVWQGSWAKGQGGSSCQGLKLPGYCPSRARGCPPKPGILLIEQGPRDPQVTLLVVLDRWCHLSGPAPPSFCIHTRSYISSHCTMLRAKQTSPRRCVELCETHYKKTVPLVSMFLKYYNLLITKFCLITSCVYVDPGSPSGACSILRSHGEQGSRRGRGGENSPVF